MIRVTDYSNEETGLHVRLHDDATGTTMHTSGTAWKVFVAQVKAGEYDHVANGPRELSIRRTGD